LATTQSRERLLSTNHVVGETWTLIRRRLGHAAAVGFLDRLRPLPNLEVAWTDEGLEGEAWAWLRRRDEREYSFVDATSFAVMRRRRIHQALAFDGDFAAAGFVEVRP
jgi:predicted nucleic acid-binding protein